MLKVQTKSIDANGNGRLPKASDFKLPKRLTARQKAMIETSEVILAGFRRAREKKEQSG